MQLAFYLPAFFTPARTQADAGIDGEHLNHHVQEEGPHLPRHRPASLTA
jgi:hypothetical protein